MKLDIGNRLKKMRMERNLTQKELAVLVTGGLDYTYIGKIERGEQLPSLKILLKISEALAVPVASFFQEESAAAAGDPAVFQLGTLAREDAGRQLLKALRQVHKDDLPLLAEIVHVLAKHRRSAEDAKEDASSEYLMAAEPVTSYKNSGD